VHEGVPAPDADLSRKRGIVEAFLKASREGDFEGLLAILDPGIVARADEAAQRLGSLAEIRGPAAVAQTFKGRAQAARAALIDGELAVAVVLGGKLRVALRLAFSGDTIAGMEAIADPDTLVALDIEML